MRGFGRDGPASTDHKVSCAPMRTSPEKEVCAVRHSSLRQHSARNGVLVGVCLKGSGASSGKKRE
jgi:hypothetical protein